MAVAVTGRREAAEKPQVRIVSKSYCDQLANAYSGLQEDSLPERDTLMYVCICNAIREKDLRCAARRLDGDAQAVYAALGCTPQCGQCLEDAEDIIAEEATAARLPAAA